MYSKLIFGICLVANLCFPTTSAQAEWSGAWMTGGEWQFLTSDKEADHYVCRIRQRTASTGEIGCPTRFDIRKGEIDSTGEMQWNPMTITGEEIQFELKGHYHNTHNGDTTYFSWVYDITVRKVWENRLEGEAVARQFRPTAYPKYRDVTNQWSVAFVRE